jgi:hypothetical protein
MKINKTQMNKMKAAVGLNERAINILYNKYVYLYVKSIPPE